MSIYVRMTDSFMSGWGKSQGKSNVHVIECDTRAQADEIEAAANQRTEMNRVMIVSTKPRARKGVIYTRRHYNDLGAVWKPWTRSPES
jgi:hypothetical protein